MFELSYEKSKNSELFKTTKSIVNVNEIQNYIPLYKKFFSLNHDNYNSINLNEKRRIKSILEKKSENVFNVKLSTKEKVDSFFKFSPLIDPLKYMMGKYQGKDVIQLPKYDSENILEELKKMHDENNSAYTDGFFYYLSSQLLNNYNFCHGTDFYGSFLCIKNDCKFNVYDDAEYLYDSTYFNKNKNELFKVNLHDEERLLKYETRNNRRKINFLKTMDNKNLSLTSVYGFDEIFTNENKEKPSSNKSKVNYSVVYEYLKKSKTCNKNISLSSSSESSECSSRSSASDTNERQSEEFSEEDSVNNIKQKMSDSEEWQTDDGEGDVETESESESESESEIDSASISSNDEVLEAVLDKFPVQMICIEKLENTLDSYIENKDEITNEEWKSIIFQVLSMLYTYQKVFDFTHNDLHTNNIMYQETDKKFLYYKINNKHYKVPTFGKLFKIIDFGRSIYKYKGCLCISDSYHPKGDAASQYNIKPYFNENKPIVEPNKSFDLCRLGCSLFDHFFETVEEGYQATDEIEKLINEWCLDYKDRNILYKRNGEERYEDFKLYKMIARTVKNKEPQVFIEREMFNHYLISSKTIKKDKKEKKIINIDIIPNLSL